MKPHKMSYKNYLVFIILFTSGILFLHAEDYKEIRNVSKSIKINPDSKINILNKYGSVSINTWEKDSVRFEIILTISGANESKVKKVSDNIDFRFSENELSYFVETRFGKDFKTFWNDLKNKSGISNTGTRNVEINYTIYTPDYIGLSIDNKYGEVYLDDFKGELKLNISNGALKAGSLSVKSDLNLNFSDAVINEFTSGIINLSYTDLSIDKCQHLELISRSSTIHIEEVDILNLNSRRDKVFLSQVKFIKGESYFSNISLKTIEKEMDFNLKYGMLKVNQINPESEKIILDLKYTDVDLYVSKQFSGKMDINIEKTVFKFPSEYNDLDITVTDDDHKSFHISGIIGSIPVKTRFNIKAIKGTLNILHE